MSIKVSTSQNSALISWIPARDGARPYPEARHRRKRSKAERGRLFRAQVGSGIAFCSQPRIVIPAKAGIHSSAFSKTDQWIPGCAGTTTSRAVAGLGRELDTARGDHHKSAAPRNGRCLAILEIMGP